MYSNNKYHLWTILLVTGLYLAHASPLDQLHSSLNLENFSTGLNKRPTLLRSPMKPVDSNCLRIYTENRYKGSWSDLCTSNELLMLQSIFRTQSVCAPKDHWWDQKRFWLLFEQPHYHGAYILLSEKECLPRINRVLPTVGSMLKCIQGNTNKPHIRCDFPQKPWREFRPMSEMDLEEQVRTAMQVSSEMKQNQVKAVSGSSEDPQVKFSTGALDKLKGGAVDWKKQA